MLTRGVHHVSFAVSDLERSRRFYEGVLELEPIPRPDLGLPGMWYRAGTSEVHLIATPWQSLEAAAAARPIQAPRSFISSGGRPPRTGSSKRWLCCT